MNKITTFCKSVCAGLAKPLTGRHILIIAVIFAAAASCLIAYLNQPYMYGTLSITGTAPSRVDYAIGGDWISAKTVQTGWEVPYKNATRYRFIFDVRPDRRVEISEVKYSYPPYFPTLENDFNIGGRELGGLVASVSGAEKVETGTEAGLVVESSDKAVTVELAPIKDGWVWWHIPFIGRMPRQLPLVLGGLLAFISLLVWNVGQKGVACNFFRDEESSETSRFTIFLRYYCLFGLLFATLSIAIPTFLQLLNIPGAKFLLPATLMVSGIIAVIWVRRRVLMACTIVSFLLTIFVSAYIVGFFIDPVYDSIRTHIPTFLQMADNWNIFYEPGRASAKLASGDVIPLHSHAVWNSKGTYWLSAGMYGLMETSRYSAYFNIVLCAVVFAAMWWMIPQLLPARWRPAAVPAALAIALNPITLSSFFTNGVDGGFTSVMMIYILSLYGFCVTGKKSFLPLVILSGVLSISFRNLGIAYAGIIGLAALLALVLQKKNHEYIFTALRAAILLGAAALILNLNPLITNLALFDNCMFPLIGKSIPAFNSSDKQRGGVVYLYNPHEVERMEEMNSLELFVFTQILPVSTRNTNSLIRFGGVDFLGNHLRAQPMICGYGGLFKIALAMALAGCVWLLIRRAGFVELLFAGGLIVSVLVNNQCYQARYVPQIYILPVIVAIGGLRAVNRRNLNMFSILTLSALLTNSVLGIPEYAHISIEEQTRLSDALAAYGGPVHKIAAEKFSACNMLSAESRFDEAVIDNTNSEVYVSWKYAGDNWHWVTLAVYKDIRYARKFRMVSKSDVLAELRDQDGAIIEAKNLSFLPDEFRDGAKAAIPPNLHNWPVLVYLEKGKDPRFYFSPVVETGLSWTFAPSAGKVEKVELYSRGEHYGVNRKARILLDGKEYSLKCDELNIVSWKDGDISSYGNSYIPEKLLICTDEIIGDQK